MSITFENRYASNPKDFKSYDTSRIREDFLIKDLMREGNVHIVYTHYDRYIAGGAVPAKDALQLETIEPLKADFFLERRELGIINVGAKGSVSVDGEDYALANKESPLCGQRSKGSIFFQR